MLKQKGKYQEANKSLILKTAYLIKDYESCINKNENYATLLSDCDKNLHNRLYDNIRAL